MSWMQKLYEAYEAAAAQGLVGREIAGQPTLLPMCHTSQKVQIEMTITMNGDFVQAVVIENPDQQRTIMPSTERSAARANGIIPMPLFDKLLYVAGDYARYVPLDGKEKKFDDYFAAYWEALEKWLPTAPVEVQAWGKYVSKRCLIGDLVACGLLRTDASGRVPAKWEGDDKPSIYKVVVGAPLDAFVRFRVQQPNDGEDRVWMLPRVRQSFIDYQAGLETKRDVCYVRGIELPVSESSPKFIRYPGDGAKLVSANDTSGFTFRGRLLDANEALVLGRDTTEKAHSALRWLIQKQGYKNGEQVILTFATGGKPLPSLGVDTLTLSGEPTDDPLAEMDLAMETYSTNEWMAQRVNLALAGYQSKLKPEDEAMVIGLDSTVAGKGRLSIFYYREMRAEDLFGRICRWHSTCSWRHTYRTLPGEPDEKGKIKYRRVPFVGAPAPVDIVKAAYGESVGDKQLKSAVERLLPCIVDGAPVPVDIMRCCARRAAQRDALEGWEADKALSIACALIRKHYNDREHKEEWGMALQPELNDRSYLFGRAWAYAEQIERYALSVAEENRTTNAERLMVAFARHPAKSWKALMERLQPYLQRLGQRANAYREEMGALIDRLGVEGYTNDPLNERYLLGYDSQKQEFIRIRNENIQKKNAQKAKEETP